jgi:ribose transport system ATP-binding protein
MPETPVLNARRFSKTFGRRTVLQDVDVEIAPGEVHGLVGQNGSGKSTFIKILAGYHVPEAGASLSVAGRQAAFPMPPGEARRLGMSFVHQDLGLINNATVLENLRVGRYGTGWLWRVRWGSEEKSVSQSLERFGLPLSPNTLVAELAPIDRALIAILRALEELEHVQRGVLVLDESTAYLPRDGIERLFSATRDIAARGFGVLFVTHRLDEIRTLADRVTILRDGRVVGAGEISTFTERDLVSRIVGFELGDLYPDASEHPVSGTSALVLSVRDLGGERVRGLNLDLRPGEIVGLTGLLGTGFEEVPYLLFGARRATSGTLTFAGRTIMLNEFAPADAKQLGLALLPSNRARDGAVGAAAVSENMTLATLAEYFQQGILRKRKERVSVKRRLDEFEVRPAEPGRQFDTLSGGNQQKTLLGKWFATRPRVLLLDEPAHGVDVGARRQIFQHLRDAAERDRTAFLIASTEAEDLAHLCDRVLVFRDGVVVSELVREELSEERITERCFMTAAAR